MINILREDLGKISPVLEKVICELCEGMVKTEIEDYITVGDDQKIANVKGYWVGDMIRIDVKFRG